MSYCVKKKVFLPLILSQYSAACLFDYREFDVENDFISGMVMIEFSLKGSHSLGQRELQFFSTYVVAFIFWGPNSRAKVCHRNVLWPTCLRMI